MVPLAGKRSIELDGHSLNLQKFYRIAVEAHDVTLSEKAMEGVRRNRALLERQLRAGKTVYGVNTGFGELYGTTVSQEKARALQLNLIRSTSSGFGESLGREEVRGMMLLRLNTLLRGFSGVRGDVVHLLAEMLNRGVHPVIPSRGSVGASGDLAPLAHMSLVLVGEGQAEYRGRIMPGSEALGSAGLKPLEIMEKEGLALINGTQMMTSLGALAIWKLKRLLVQAPVVFSISFQALGGNLDAFDPRVFEIRSHRGCLKAASAVRRICSGWNSGGNGRLQDAYTLRCYPQVMGPLFDFVDFAESTVVTEMNSTNDNPLVFDDGDVISAGNFHGEPIAVALDALCIPLQAYISFTERRIARLLDSKLSGLPPFLASRPGLESGYMIAQYAAASMVGEGNVLSHPASSHSVPTSANQEDFVSMGAWAALKLRQMTALAYSVTAIEALVGAQALEMSGHRPSPAVRLAVERIRRTVPPLTSDRMLSDEICSCVQMLESGVLEIKA